MISAFATTPAKVFSRPLELKAAIGPKPPSSDHPECCGAARHCGHSRMAQHFRQLIDRFADKNVILLRLRHVFFGLVTCYRSTKRSSIGED
jgi:hypothetical protein